MKQLSIILISVLTMLSVTASPYINGDAVTISISGNKNLQVSIDGRDINAGSGTILANKTTIAINNLTMGQHTLQVTRTDMNSMRSGTITATFTLRNNFEMLINVNSNGSLELIENIKAGVSDNQVAMSAAEFNTLLRNVKVQRAASGRRSVIANAFNNTGKYFTTSQVIQLLQTVTAENFRLQLSKLSYRGITDRSNFYQVYDLINSQSGKNELVAYVNNYNEGVNPDAIATEASFNTLYQTIQQQWPVSTQMNSLTNAFNSTSNHFTTSQASQLIQIVGAEANRLQLAKLSYRSISDPANFGLIYNLLSTQASKNELAAYINTNYNTGNNSNGTTTEANFNSLYQTIQQQWPVSTQMNSLTSAFNNTSNYFTVSQASQLIQIIGAEANRLQLAKLSYRSITDPGNFSQIYNLLSTQASKNELATYLNTNYSTGSTTNVAMNDANFTTLYEAVRAQYLPFEQMNSLTSVFNNTSNYFTTAQAKQLIPMVSSENNRLQLAKLSYRTIVDRANFSQLYDLLNNQANRNDLEAYVKAYKD